VLFLAAEFSGVLTDLSGRQDGDEILINQSDLLDHSTLILLVLQLLHSQPEQHVLLAVFETQELAEHAPSSCSQRAKHNSTSSQQDRDYHNKDYDDDDNDDDDDDNNNNNHDDIYGAVIIA